MKNLISRYIGFKFLIRNILKSNKIGNKVYLVIRKLNILFSKKYNYFYNPFRRYISVLHSIEIEITTDCNLRCLNCDRSCRNAPSKECMSIDQIKRFVNDSIKLNWFWKRISLIGGEPFLHQELEKIIFEIERYYSFNKKCMVNIITNGLVKPKIFVPSWVNVYSSNKKSSIQFHDNFNMAPIDYGINNAPYCDIPWRCGLGLTKYGIFPCGAGASICRVFGFDIGIINLQELKKDNIFEQLKFICKYCGHSPTKLNKYSYEEQLSKSWEQAFERYAVSKPELTLY